MSSFEHSEYFQAPKHSNIKHYMMDSLPNRLICCRRSQKELLIQQAIEQMSKETDIIEMIKSRRYFNLALKKLLSTKERMTLKERSRYLCIDSENLDASHAMEDDYKLTKLCDIGQPKKKDIDNILYTDGFCSSSYDESIEESGF